MGKQSNTSAKALYPFTEYNTFQGFYKIKSADEGQDLNYVFNKCILHVTDWLKSRLETAKEKYEEEKKTDFDPSEYSFLDDYPSVEIMKDEGFDVFAAEKPVVSGSGPRFDINILGLKDYGEWTISIFEPNNGANTNDQDRLFTTEIALKKTSDYIFLALKVMCKESYIKHDAKAIPFRPVFIRDIIEDPELIVSEGNIESEEYPINIAKLNIDLKGNLHKDEFAFLNIICDPKRQMPVVFCPASGGYNKKVYKELINSFSWSMSGEAYVITDEHGDISDSYRGLFEKMNSSPSFDILKKAKLPVKDAIDKIKNNYLIIHPFMNGVCDIEWHSVNGQIKSAVNPDDIKKKITVEVYNIRKDVGLSLMDRREGSGCPVIVFGDVIFYSELWNKYIGISYNETIENLRNENDEYKHKLNEMINNLEVYSQDQINELMEKHDREVKSAYEELQKQYDELEQKLRKKDSALTKAQNEAENAAKAEAEFNQKKADLDAILNLQDDLIEFFVKLQSVPCEKGKLLDWIEETMVD